MNEIRYVAIDLGGVLFTEGKENMLPILKEKYGYDDHLIRSLLRSEKYYDMVSDEIEFEEYWDWFQSQLPSNYDAETIKTEWFNAYRLDNEIVSLIGKLRLNYKVVIFSGNFKERVNYLEKKFSFKKFFDGELFSFDCKARGKKDPGFYFSLIKKLNVKPQEIIIIDNRERSVKIAESFGMNGVVYESGKINDLMGKLKELGAFIS